jgi:hypothetical protein
MEYIQETPEVNANPSPSLKAKGRQKPPKRLPPIRLSPPDVAIIAAGVAWIVANHETWRSKGRALFARPDVSWLPTFNRGQYSEELMQRFLAAAHSVVEIRCNGGRLYEFDPFQIAGLILAVRVITRRVRHGHQAAPAGNLTNRAKRLVDCLEKYRKRAKRDFICQHGNDEYQMQARKWQALVRWLRTHLLDCSCVRKRRDCTKPVQPFDCRSTCYVDPGRAARSQEGGTERA